MKVYEAEKGIVQALRGVDVAARPGSVTAIAGPSGSGKSTLLRIIAAIDVPTAGDVTVAGVSVSGMSPRDRRTLRRRSVGYVHQQPTDNLLPDLTIGEQLTLVANHRGASPADVERLADLLGLGGRLSHVPGEMSGGEQQRAAMVRASLGDPSVIIADEPTAELDSATTDAVCELLGDIARDRDAAVVIATHDPQVMQAADHILFLRDGAVQSETFEGVERAVIDSTGRIQLPPEVLAWYPDQRVRLEFDPETNTIVIKP
ncbi:MAG: ABC transporter ATP-binding protein [Acidimicrobiia bacterium]|nr:ABC transporter ATP-binding protein [Acidimicrobiia bacterium]MBT8215178.1 ABC transporter ATP-binding protein [Acidimicrobiia bacterium]NNF69849.1 ABC transporter ATP-binding protein [Acidimicrobiia bacterium]NNK92199.1 ABC transporter ATP-binding protein [Acidimicrobiia bacterium]